MAEVTAKQDGVATVLAIDGEVETQNAHYVRRRCLSLLTNEASAIVLDLTRTTYLDSAGISLAFELARLAESWRQTFAIVTPEDAALRRVLEVAGVPGALTIVATVDDALRRIRDAHGSSA